MNVHMIQEGNKKAKSVVIDCCYPPVVRSKAWNFSMMTMFLSLFVFILVLLCVTT